MLEKKNICTAVIDFLTPSKTILYDTKLTEDEIYNIVYERHTRAVGTSFFDRAVGGNIYDYEMVGNKIYVKPVNAKGGHDSSAYIEIVTNKFGETILSVTYYKPLLIALACTALGAVISIAGSIWAIFIAITFGFSMNYFFFQLDWRKLETEIMRVFKID